MKAAAPTEKWCESHGYRLHPDGRGPGQATSQLRGQQSQRRIERAGPVWSPKRRLRRYVGEDRLRGAAMFGTSWRVGRIAGIEVRVDSSWVVIALLITYSMYLRFSFLRSEEH